MIEAIVQGINDIDCTLEGEITDGQSWAIFYITKDAGYGCTVDENSFLQLIFGDDLVTNLSKADAYRFIEYFGEKEGGKWFARTDRKTQFSELYNEIMRLDGQDTLF